MVPLLSSRAGLYPFGVASLVVTGLLVVGLAQHGAGVQPPQPDRSPKRSAARAGNGAGLFRQQCGRCHGDDGRGARIRRSLPEIPDFTSARWHERHSNAQLRVSIVDGKGDGMPAFGDRLDEGQVRDLIASIRAFGPTPATPTNGSPGDFERRFQALQQQMEALRRQFEELSALPYKPATAAGNPAGMLP